MPKFSQDASKSSPNPPQIDPKAIQKASWSPSWTIVLKRYDLERPTNSKNAPKSGPKTLQSVPNPSQMGPKAFPNRFLSDLFAFVFPFWICIVFSLSLYRLFVNFSKLEPLILSLLSRRNAIFCKIAVSKKMRKNTPKTGPKPSQNLPKSFKNR